MIVPGLAADWVRGRLLAGQQGHHVGHAEQPRHAADDHIGQDLGLPGIDRSVEDQRHADPVLTHAGEVTADPPVAVEHGHGLVAIAFGARLRAGDERFGGRVRATRRRLRAGRSRGKRQQRYGQGQRGHR